MTSLALGSHMRAALIAEKPKALEAILEDLETVLDSEYRRRRRRGMMVDPRAVTEAVLFIIERDKRLRRFASSPELISELQEAVVQYGLATRVIRRQKPNPIPL